MTYRCSSLVLGVVIAIGCGPGDEGNGPGAPDSGVVVDKGPVPDTKPPTALKVAAVQYASGQQKQVKACGTDVCALSALAREAAQKGALIVNTPEYATDQSESELAPNVGEKPAADSRWPEGSIIRAYAMLADELNITFIFDVITEDKTGSLYNTSLAVDGQGKVVARHHKFQLFGGEAKQLTPGPSLATSFFQTIGGKAGLMICADAQCVVTWPSVSSLCTSHAKGMTASFSASKPRIVFFSSVWTIEASDPYWGSISVQKKLAQSFGAYVVAANTTESGYGVGGGIYKPGGDPIVSVESTKPTILYADLPLAK